MIERLELEAFLTLAEELHFGRTAERLHVSTGRISQTIKTLERRIGAPLFERSSRSVQLTELGHRLYEDIRPGYEQLQAGLDRAIAAVRGTRQELTVGFVSALAGQVVHQAADLFPEYDPECRIRPREAQVIEALPRLRAGDFDVLVLSLPLDAPDLVVGPPVIAEPRMLLVPASHPLARRAGATMEDLADIPLLRIAGTRPGDWPADRRHEQTPSGRTVTAGPEFETFQEALQLIGTGQGGFICGAQVTRFYARPDITCVPFTDAPPLEWAPVWLRTRSTPRIRTFVRVAQEVANRIYTAATHQ